MTDELRRLSETGRRAVQSRNWPAVSACAGEILRHDPGSPEGHFLAGLVEKAAQRPVKAAEAFAKALELDAGRYDAAIELANQHCIGRRNAEAAALLRDYEARLGNSPRYLDMAGTTYSASRNGRERAWPLYLRANELQPGVPLFQSNLAACGVFLGKIDEARRSTDPCSGSPDAPAQSLPAVPPGAGEGRDACRADESRSSFHQPAAGQEHLHVLRDRQGARGSRPSGQEAFHYYQMAGDAVTSVADYDVAADLELIDRIIEVCDADWLAAWPDPAPPTSPPRLRSSSSACRAPARP